MTLREHLTSCLLRNSVVLAPLAAWVLAQHLAGVLLPLVAPQGWYFT